MTRLTQQLKNVANETALTPHEKETMRRFVRASLAQRSMSSVFVPRVAMACTAVVMCVGLLSYAAEQASPGERLYLIKTNVNERVRDVLPGSAEQDMEWEVTKQERRDSEMQLMAAELGL